MLATTIKHLFHPHRGNKHRARILHPESLFALVLLVVGFTGLFRLGTMALPREGWVLGYASSITPGQVAELTNAERAKAGLPALTMNSALSQAAAGKAQDMFTNQYWAHNSPAGKKPWDFIRAAGYGYSVAGENLARDFSNSGDMMNAWMNSPTHKANIVSGKYTEIGIAVVDGTLQGVETTLVVQMFGSRGATKPAITEKALGVTAPAVAVVQTTPAPQVAQALPTPVATPFPTILPDSSLEPVAELTTVGPDGTVAELASAPVLSSLLVPLGSISHPPLFSPLQLTKAVFLGVVLMIMLTLVYDTAMVSSRTTVRFVGKNMAHILMLLTVLYLLLFFKGGIVG